MTTICLVRHGETDWNVLGKLQGTTDIPLNQVGISQGKECASYLAAFPWDIIITSPLKRAKGTAEIINEQLKLQLVEDGAFKERSFGDAEGMTAEERTATFRENEYPNQEDRELFIERLMGGLQGIAQDYSGKRVLLTAHGAVINAILSELSKGEIGSGKTRLHNACLSTIVWHGDRWEVKDYNQVTHLSHAKEATGLIL